MNKISHKIGSIIMSFVVLFSTMSFTIDMHFCGDVLVDIGVLNDAESCGMEAEETSHFHDYSLAKKDCCNDEKIIIDGQDDLNASFEKLNFEKQVFVSALVYSYINLFIEENANTTPFKNYTPPLIVKNIQVLDNVFLI